MVLIGGGGMEVLGKLPIPMSVCPPQIPQPLLRVRDGVPHAQCVSVVGSHP